MKIGANDISKIYLGGSEVEKIYLGTEQVYGGEPTPPTPTPYDEQYLTIESTSNNNTIYWKSLIRNQYKTILASTDNGSTWTAYTSAYNNGTTIATLNSGDTIIFKGENAQYNSQGIFKSTSSFIVYGNVMSLVYGDDFAGQKTLTGENALFSSLFLDCTNITSAENLVLPATALTQNCYDSMFKGCTSLTTAPELPATTLANNCYNGMFYGCTSLTNAPVLPATTLANGCYQYMFYGCTSLTTAPELPATTLANNCYKQMFYNCTSLNYIKAMFTTTPSATYTQNWVKDVASSGTFVKNSVATWDKSGVHGIPTGWKVQNA